MTCDGAVDGGDAQLFPEEWRDRLDEKLTDGIVIPCPHCSGNAPAGSPPVEPITFILDEPSDAAERQRAVDSLLASGTYVIMLLDEECAVAEKRKEPFFVVLSLDDDGEIHVETLNRKGMAERYVSSARAAVIAERSIAKISEAAAADVRAIFERLQDLASNNPNTIIEIGVALGMDEGEMRRKMLATPAAATGDEKVAWAELAKSVMDTAKVMLARFMYACEAAGLDKQTRDGDPITAMRALSAIIGENRRVAAVREGGAQGRGR